MEGDRTEVGESDMKRRKRGKQTLKRKMLSILLLCAMSCILAVVIVSYMTIRMIQNDSIQESMQIYLEQITREIDSDYYDMIGEYYGAAEPPVRCGESHLSGLTEPPHFVY